MKKAMAIILACGFIIFAISGCANSQKSAEVLNSNKFGEVTHETEIYKENTTVPGAQKQTDTIASEINKVTVKSTIQKEQKPSQTVLQGLKRENNKPSDKKVTFPKVPSPEKKDKISLDDFLIVIDKSCSKKGKEFSITDFPDVGIEKVITDDTYDHLYDDHENFRNVVHIFLKTNDKDSLIKAAKTVLAYDGVMKVNLTIIRPFC